MTIRSVSDAPNGAAAAVCQQPIHNTQLLTDRIAAEDGGMFVDAENGVERVQSGRTGVPRAGFGPLIDDVPKWFFMHKEQPPNPYDVPGPL